MAVSKAQAGPYAKAMKNSIEVLFEPTASVYGHLLVRVGERLYDFPGPWGTRNQKFSTAMRYVNSHAYGFVYPRTAKQIQKLQREFEKFANAGHRFSEFGSGPTEFSCAAFVTSVLKTHAPDLKIGLNVGAISCRQSHPQRRETRGSDPLRLGHQGDRSKQLPVQETLAHTQKVRPL